MIPKLALNVSRAAAAVQNQTSHTIRNVLQYQSQSAAAPSSASAGSSWGGHAGTGGAKYNAGSRFYNGYTGAGRSITQANASSANDGTNGQANDEEERKLPRSRVAYPAPRSVRSRARSSSLSTTALARDELDEKPGVLQAVRLHTQSRSPFIESTSSSARPEIDVATSEPARARRNSTASSSHPTLEPLLETSEAAAPASSVNPVDPAAPQSVNPPVLESQFTAAEQEILEQLDASLGNYATATSAITALRESGSSNVVLYNKAIALALSVRTIGQAPQIALDLYKELIARGTQPNSRTYRLVIGILCDRDVEVQRAIWGLTSRRDRIGTSSQVIGERLSGLQEETNFEDAIRLFRAAVSRGATSAFSASFYSDLIRSCSFRGDVSTAIQAFAVLERSKVLPTPQIFLHLLGVYNKAKDYDGAQEIFKEFLVASREGRIQESDNGSGQRSQTSVTGQMQVWNRMIETTFATGNPAAGLALLEQMFDSKAGENYGLKDIPPPSSSTYQTIINGFCEAGDVDSALAWFDKLLAQPNPPPSNPFAPFTTPCRPNSRTWEIMLDHLCHLNRVDDVNRLWRTRCQHAASDSPTIRPVERHIVFSANIQALSAADLSAERANELMDFLINEFLPNEMVADYSYNIPDRAATLIFVEQLIARGRSLDALNVTESVVSSITGKISQGLLAEEVSNDVAQVQTRGLREFVVNASTNLFKSGTLSLKDVMRIAALGQQLDINPEGWSQFFVQAYADAVAQGQAIKLSTAEWRLLANAFVEVESATQQTSETAFSSPGLPTLLDGFATHGISPSILDASTQQAIVHQLVETHGHARALELVQSKGSALDILIPLFDALKEPSEPVEAAPVETPAEIPQIRIDLIHGRFVDEHHPTHPFVTPQIAYSRFAAGVKNGIYPSPEVIGRLINAIGRQGQFDIVQELYTAAQVVLRSLEHEKRWQSIGWFQIEDNMISALAHAGQFDAAMVHRQRIIESNGSPSADAYGALISAIKDTTDDAGLALQLFEESQSFNVRANLYLYNTIISKLSKARKADGALELFQRMKASGIRPSAVTYGALIGACCRVGDALSAEHLFAEMTAMPNFRPRVPPYNTMIQLYTNTKPDRERALSYFHALLQAKVKPTAHTYKLLIDCYGTIEPVDPHSMQDVFERLVSDSNVQVAGTHWAGLINAWGCASKDLDRAIAVFNSIATHPSTAKAATPLPDSLAYEAIINVIVTHHRHDLLPEFIQRMQDAKIHMTAYISNLLIKGYAAAGEMDRSRAIFEGLEDPPTGVAAPFNHPSHEGASPSVSVHPQTPIYREPSTWEVMVRAELGSGNRERALDLLGRMQARNYPEAVTARISGILLDEDVPSTPPQSELSGWSSS